MAKEKAFQIPKKLGACADLLYTLRVDRLAIEKTVDDLKKKENTMKAHLLVKLGAEQAAKGIVGELATVRVLSETIPVVSSWEDLSAYIVKNNAVDLLQRRLSNDGVKSRWEEGKAVPGVDKLATQKLSITKR
jgi:hypothetical protein